MRETNPTLQESIQQNFLEIIEYYIEYTQE